MGGAGHSVADGPNDSWNSVVFVPIGSMDAPDLGLRNRRFHKLAFRFKDVGVFIGKNAIPASLLKFTTREQKKGHSSTNSSTLGGVRAL